MEEGGAGLFVGMTQAPKPCVALPSAAYEFGGWCGNADVKTESPEHGQVAEWPCSALPH
jgi:hypothetical protein